MDNGLNSLEGEMFSNTADLSDMEVSQFAYSVDVGFEGESVVKDNVQVSSINQSLNL